MAQDCDCNIEKNNYPIMDEMKKNRRGRKVSNRQGKSIVKRALPKVGAAAVTVVSNKLLTFGATKIGATTNAATYAAGAEIVTGILIDEVGKGKSKFLNETAETMVSHGSVEVLKGLTGDFLDSIGLSIRNGFNSLTSGSTSASTQAALAAAAAVQANKTAASFNGASGV